MTSSCVTPAGTSDELDVQNEWEENTQTLYSNKLSITGLLPSGNPFKYHVEALSLQPMKQYIITTMLDVVLHGFCFVFAFCLVWCPCMEVNVSVQYNGGLLPDIILLT